MSQLPLLHALCRSRQVRTFWCKELQGLGYMHALVLLFSK